MLPTCIIEGHNKYEDHITLLKIGTLWDTCSEVASGGGDTL